MIMNSVGMVGRIIAALIADKRLGILQTLIPTVCITGVVLLGWIGVDSTESQLVWAAIYGIFANAVQALLPGAMGELSKDPSRVGTRIGMILLVGSVSCLTGPPIGGRLIAINNGNYLYAQLFGGLSMVAGCLTFLLCFLRQARLEKGS